MESTNERKNRIIQSRPWLVLLWFLSAGSAGSIWLTWRGRGVSSADDWLSEGGLVSLVAMHWMSRLGARDALVAAAALLATVFFSIKIVGAMMG